MPFGLPGRVGFFLRFFLFMVGLWLFMTILIFGSSKIRINEKGTLLKNVTGNPANKGESTIFRFYEAEKIKKPVDVLIVGTSRAYRAYDPVIFENNGLNVHILATRGQTMALTYYLLKRYLPVLKPRIVIVDVAIPFLFNSGLESFFDLCANMPLSPEHFCMAATIDQPTAYFVWYATLLNQINTPFFEDDFDFNPPKGYNKGFISDLKSDSLLTINKQDTARFYRRLNQQEIKNIRYLRRSIQLLIGHDIKPVITRQPVIAREVFNAGSRINRLAAEYGVPYFDLNKNLNHFDIRRDFYDHSHLNANGAAVATRIVTGELMKAGIINQ